MYVEGTMFCLLTFLTQDTHYTHMSGNILLEICHMSCRNQPILSFLTLATIKQGCTVCRTFTFLESDILPCEHTV